MANLEESEMTFQRQETVQPDPPGDLTSFQFVPDKIVDFSILQDGQRSYRVRWKDSWLTEELLSLTYQHLINEFWSSAATTAAKSDEKSKTGTAKTKTVKIIGKQEHFDSHYQSVSGQQTGITITPSAVEIETVRTDEPNVGVKGINDASSTSLLDSTTLIKTQSGLQKLQAQAVNSNNLSSMVVNSDVSLATGLQYPDMPSNMSMLTAPTIPKYQQALQQQITVQQQQLTENTETGKVTFPKHVYSQARFVNKKQQQQLVAADQPRVSCDICNKSLKTKKMLWAHKVAVHFGGNFPCDLCGKKCITGAELRRHMTSHSTERKFVCQYCGLAYKRWSHLYQHLRVHEEEKNFRCDVCHLNFKVQSELKDHCFAEHSLGDVVQCSVCKHNLQTPLAVYHHSMKHTGTRDFVCEICGSNFKRKQHLVTHMKTHLTEKKAGGDGSNEIYECQACDQTFELKMDMKTHCDSAHPLPGDENVTCKTCSKKLNISSSVYLHGLRHSGSRNFQCDECNQLFKRKAHLLRHKADRHPVEPRERKKRSVSNDTIVCTLCRRSFKYRTALIKHMAGQHGVLPKSDFSSNPEISFKKGIKKPHQCAQCMKRFKSKGSLAKHKLNKHNIASEVDIVVQYTGDSENQTDDKSDIDTSSATMVTRPMENVLPTDHEENSENMMKVENTIVSIGSGSNEQAAQSDHASVNTSDSAATTISLSDISHSQVITVDQETGQIILLGTTVPSSNHEDESKSNVSRMVTVSGDGTHQESQISTVATNQHMSTGLSSIQHENNEGSSELSQQVSMGQIISQDGVTLTTVPIQSVQGLDGSQNVIDFSQSNNEQIVVLLSALNSQNIQQM